ncbi:hypothetical protein CRENBAI_015877 [Crenichthys baileyi]|uniref:Protein Wnt n=1 Tax=Crenichthys baileyi TaxID=28760 RepID=A0AAV9R444_9TELE
MSPHLGVLLERFCETLRMIYLGSFLLFCGLTHVMASYPIWWSLAMGHQYSSIGTQPILCGSIPGLVPKQLRFCRNYVEIMPSVAEGVKIGIQECQHQFRGRRWNCTTINDNLAIFGPVLDKGHQGTIETMPQRGYHGSSASGGPSGEKAIDTRSLSTQKKSRPVSPLIRRGDPIEPLHPYITLNRFLFTTFGYLQKSVPSIAQYLAACVVTFISLAPG